MIGHDRSPNISSGKRIVAMPRERVLSCCSTIGANWQTSGFSEHLQNCASEGRWHSVGYLLHLIGKRTVNSKTVRESLKSGSLPHGDAAGFFEVRWRRSVAGKKCVREAC